MGSGAYHIQNQLRGEVRKLINLSKNLFWWMKSRKLVNSCGPLKYKNVCEYVAMATVWLTHNAL